MHPYTLAGTRICIAIVLHLLVTCMLFSEQLGICPQAYNLLIDMPIYKLRLTVM